MTDSYFFLWRRSLTAGLAVRPRQAGAFQSGSNPSADGPHSTNRNRRSPPKAGQAPSTATASYHAAAICDKI